MIRDLFNRIRARGNASQPVKRLNEELNAALVDAPVVPEPVKETPKPLHVAETSKENGENLTLRAHMELIHHEAIVLEAYKDSVGVWTWGVGVTNASGHKVHPRYLGKPQTLTRVLEVYEWLIRTKYLPEVRAAFHPMRLNEHQLAAALSFHWNTGAIARASWVRSFREGNISAARQQFMNWRNPPEIIKRREAERDLFFDGKWSKQDTKARIIHRVHPNGNPVWRSAVMTDISAELADVLARAG